MSRVNWPATPLERLCFGRASRALVYPSRLHCRLRRGAACRSPCRCCCAIAPGSLTASLYCQWLWPLGGLCDRRLGSSATSVTLLFCVIPRPPPPCDGFLSRQSTVRMIPVVSFFAVHPARKCAACNPCVNTVRAQRRPLGSSLLSSSAGYRCP